MPNRIQNFIVETSRILGMASGEYQKAKAELLRKPDFVAGLAQQSQWSGGNLSNTEGAQLRAARNSWFYAGINKKALDLSGAKLDIYNNPSGLEDDGVKAEAHPFYSVLRRPNPYMGKSLLMQYTQWWMDLSGEGFWFMNPEPGGIKELWPIPSNKMDMEFTPDGKRLVRYIAKLQQWYNIDPSYIIHFKYPNPWDFFRGLPPLIAFMLTIDADLAMKMWNGSFFGKDNVMPSAIISLGTGDANNMFESKDVDAVRDELKNEYSAIQRKTIVTNANTMSAALLGWNAKDMDFLSGMQWNKEEILIALGVPPGLLDKNATEANAKVGDKVFKDYMWGTKGLLADEITTQCLQVFYADTLEARFEDDRIRDRAAELQEAQIARDAMPRELWAKKYFNVDLAPGDVTMNESKQQAFLEVKKQTQPLQPDTSKQDTGSQDKDKPAGNTGTDKPDEDNVKKSVVRFEGVPEYKSGYLPSLMLKELTANKGQRTSEHLQAMEKEIRENGISTPVWIVRHADNSLEIIDGKHRVDFANQLDIEQVPVKVVNDMGDVVDTEFVYREWLSKGATNTIIQAKSLQDFNALFNKAQNFYKQKKIKSISFTSNTLDSNILKGIIQDLQAVEEKDDIGFIRDHWESVLFSEAGNIQANIKGAIGGYANGVYVMGHGINKGGDGSGNFGHEGRPGEVGGSSDNGGTSTVENYAEGKVPKKLLDEVKGWESGDRRAIALGTITARSGNDISLLKDNGEIVGVVGYRPERLVFDQPGVPKGKYTYIDGIATKRSGYGKQAMQLAIDKAKLDGTGISLHANNAPVGFYQNIGMNQSKKDEKVFFWTAKEIQKLGTLKNIELKSLLSWRPWSSLQPAFVQAIYNALQRILSLLLDNASEDLANNNVVWSSVQSVFRGDVVTVMQDIASKAVQDTYKVLSSSEMNISYDMANALAREWAMVYSATEIKNIDDTTKDAVRKTIADWISSGRGNGIDGLKDALASMKDGNGNLLFDMMRAERIAISEITSIYAGAKERALTSNGYPPAVYKPRAHVACRCMLQPGRLPSGEKVIIWFTARDERVCTQELNTPWGIVEGCKDLHRVIVSEGRAGEKWQGNTWNPKSSSLD